MKKFILALMVISLLPLTGQAAPKESLFFTQSQLFEIMRANQGFIKPKPQSSKKAEAATVVDRGRRVITLSGLVYHGPDDWTIWLNGQRVTPKNIPEQVRSLVVKPDRILLKWHDVFMQRVVSLTLRPHQQYNIDLDTISPGT